MLKIWAKRLKWGCIEGISDETCFGYKHFVAALIKNSLTREILVHPEMEYIVSEFVFQEIELNKQEILQKSRLQEAEFELLLENLKDKLILVPDAEIKHKNEALAIMWKIDINDAIFIALALST